jgi:hypothetical protein
VVPRLGSEPLEEAALLSIAGSGSCPGHRRCRRSPRTCRTSWVNAKAGWRTLDAFWRRR